MPLCRTNPRPCQKPIPCYACRVIRRLLTAVACTFLLFFLLRVVETHGTGAVTWNREISRVVFDKCGSCHRPDGTAFSLMTYADAQPRANEIKDAVLARRMPPWGGVKGFGQFRNDSSLSQEQIELITKWVDGGIRAWQQSGHAAEGARIQGPRPPAHLTSPFASAGAGWWIVPSRSTGSSPRNWPRASPSRSSRGCLGARWNPCSGSMPTTADFRMRSCCADR